MAARVPSSYICNHQQNICTEPAVNIESYNFAFQDTGDELLEVVYYNIELQPSIVNTIHLPPNSTSCSFTDCNHLIDVPTKPLETDILVVMTASNTVGESQPTVCNARPISKKSCDIASSSSLSLGLQIHQVQ